MKIFKNKNGFTLMEILIVVVIIGVLAAAATPYYSEYVEREKSISCLSSLRMFADSIERYMAMHNETLPDNFAQLDLGIDTSKFSNDNTTYNDGTFTFTITNVNGVDYIMGARNTGIYTLYYSLDDNADILCSSGTTTSGDSNYYCTNKLNLKELESEGI